MKNTTTLLASAALAAMMLAGNSCTMNDPNPKVICAEWTVTGQDHQISYGATRNGNEYESDCDDNNKMWLKLGSVPTQNTKYVIVSYTKTSYAPNEVGVDIAHSDIDFLSSGKAADSARIEMIGSKLEIYFDNVTMTNTKTNTTTTMTGYLYEQ